MRNAAFKTADTDYHVAADLTGQANHLGVTIQADIIKQKLPENNGGYEALKFGKTHKKVYTELTSENPIDWTRYQVANCYMGRIGLINSGGASGDNDMRDAVATASSIALMTTSGSIPFSLASASMVCCRGLDIVKIPLRDSPV